MSLKGYLEVLMSQQEIITRRHKYNEVSHNSTHKNIKRNVIINNTFYIKNYFIHYIEIQSITYLQHLKAKIVHTTGNRLKLPWMMMEVLISNEIWLRRSWSLRKFELFLL